VAANDPTSVAVANTVADQLRGVGILASVLALDPPALYGDALTQNRVDAIVGWHQAGGDLATALASRFGCPALEATPVPTTPPSGTPTSSTSASSTSTSNTSPSSKPTSPTRPSTTPRTSTPSQPPSTTPTATPPPPLRPSESDQLVQAPSNLTGICDRSIQPNIDAALDGSQSIGDVLTAVEPRLWNMSTVLPILQDTTIVAAAPNVENVSLSGAVPVGIVGDAGKWVREPQ
ncbi:MAG: ABC transporter family substrate-binding protein, partial [Actinomycetota bacterium]|nr:ABC transporter family substrate-binding protein [Actinomycetota bacterium]